MSKNVDFCHLEETYVTNMEDDYWIVLLKQN